MSLYKQYIEERTSDHVLETDYGFAVYSYIEPKTVYIKDIYVSPKYRGGKTASNMADTIVRLAKEQGCTTLLGSVQPSTKNSTVSLKVLLGYEMTLKSAFQDAIYFEKVI